MNFIRRSSPLAVLIALALATCSACSEPAAGAVMDRHYKPAYTWVLMVCASYRSNGTCAVMVPTTQVASERWVLVLREGEDTSDRTVTEGEYVPRAVTPEVIDTVSAYQRLRACAETAKHTLTIYGVEVQ